jgi:hypothetical protein
MKKYIAQGGSVDEEGHRKFAYGNGQNNAGDLPRYYFSRLVFDQLEKEGVKEDVVELRRLQGQHGFFVG